MFNMAKYFDYSIRKEMNGFSLWRDIQVIFSPPTVPGEGEHKCEAPDTPVLMWTGEIKEIKDIAAGEKVIGDDGLPRNVISTITGKGRMFRIDQNHGQSYTVNKNHILCFKIADQGRISYSEQDDSWAVGYLDKETMTYKKKSFAVEKYGGADRAAKLCENCRDSLEDTLDISVADYLDLPQDTKKLLYGYKCEGIRWPRKEVLIDPYILGTWLGGGRETCPSITSADDEIINARTNFAKTIKCEIRKDDNFGFHTGGGKYDGGPSPFAALLKKYNLIGNKHIPNQYLCNDREVRLQLLAGLIDAGGTAAKKDGQIWLEQGPSDFTLFDQVVLLARSLGFKCSVGSTRPSCAYSAAKYLTISGNIEGIPTKMPRNRCRPADNAIDIDGLRTKITVTPVGEGDYVGITIEGNQRFLHSDCTVVHNCLDYIRSLPDGVRANDSHCIFGPDGDLIMLTLAAHVPKMLLLREDQYNVDHIHLLDMGRIRKELPSFMGQPETRSLNDVADDFIFQGFFVGNDFLPKIQMFHRLEDGLEKMLSTYRRVTTGTGSGSSGEQNLVIDGELNLQGFYEFISLLAEEEEYYLSRQVRVKAPEEKFVNKTLLDNVTIDKKNNHTLNFEGYRQGYYAKMGIDLKNPECKKQIKELCHSYIKTLIWIFKYYIKGLPAWRWAYEYHYAPLMYDLSRHLSESVMKGDTYTFNHENASIPFEQLLSVLPTASAELLPKPYRKLMTSPSSELVEHGYYPERFEIDFEGKDKDFQGVVLLPFVDYEEVHRCYEKMKKHVKTQYSRNKLGKNILYWYDKTYRVRYSSDVGNIINLRVRSKELDPLRV